MSQSRQSVDFVLIRSGQFSTVELAVISYINSFSEYCAPRAIADIGVAIGKSERTVRRAIDSLVLKGMITKTYRTFKRVTLRLVDLAHQKSIRGVGMIKKVIRNVRKSHNKSSDRTSMTDLIRTSMTEPIQNKDQENKRSSEFNFFNKKETAMEQIARYLATKS